MTFDVEAFIGNYLSHAGDYDPAKARDYYLRTRKLKGRKKGSVDVPSGDRPSSSAGGPGPRGRPTASVLNVSQKNQAAAAERVANITARLTKLQGVLSKLLEDAGSSSSTSKEQSKSEDSKKSTEKKTDEKPLTAKEKADARDRAAKSYEKNKESSKEASGMTSEERDKKVAQVRAQIADIRAKLKKAIEDARDPGRNASTSKTASGR